MSRGKKIYFGLLLLSIFLVSTMYFSYAFFTSRNEEHGKLNIVAGTLNYKVESKDLENNKITVGATQTKKVIIDIESLNEIESKYELYYLMDGNMNQIEIGYDTNTKNEPRGIINPKEKKEVSVIIQNKNHEDATIEFKVIGGFVKNELVLSEGNRINKSKLYVENILKGTEPVLQGELIPVVIETDGKVKKANLESEWYSYEKKNWANAVILKNKNVSYTDNQIIPEENIESYFVWIPKYSYQIFDMGNYNSLTTIGTQTQEINIKFGTENTNDANNQECATPMKSGQGISGASGNCSIGKYMTHPAFLAFDVNGFWVGKFETGYDGAKTKEEAEKNEIASDKIIIKPNVYSWRNITIANIFENSYQYERDLESHMMKNTEWGAVAYLSHSKYGSTTRIRVNNNSNFVTGYAGKEEPTLGYSKNSINGNRYEAIIPGQDGNYTVNYLNNQSNISSTTGNRTGIYDMSGGTWEYMLGYYDLYNTITGGNSGILAKYPAFFTDSYFYKYYDSYLSQYANNYDHRILGDATGELGPFGTENDPDGNPRNSSSWYKNQSDIISQHRFYIRGGCYIDGSLAGVFSSSSHDGGNYLIFSFRIVLAPNG